jgi:hypothetical protein
VFFCIISVSRPLKINSRPKIQLAKGLHITQQDKENDYIFMPEFPNKNNSATQTNIMKEKSGVKFVVVFPLDTELITIETHGLFSKELDAQ